jgi:lipid-A-disaccharide synthase
LFNMSSTTSNCPQIMMVAGEASGDLHGAGLITALLRRREDLRITGCGGPGMLAAGQEQIFDLSGHAVFGLAEVMRHYFKFRSLFTRLVAMAVEEKPEAVVLIDNSGFNLRVAAALRPQLPGARFIYYVGPQVWASRSRRVKQMARDLDLLLSIFPFEQQWYHRKAPHFRVRWVGHPMLDRLNPDATVTARPDRIALMPGSRAVEVDRHLPLLWEAAVKMSAAKKGLHFVLIAPNEERQKQVLDWIAQQPAPNFAFESFCHYPLSHLSRCQLALVKSGTATLDCAFARVPAVVVYKLNPLTYEVAKRVVKVKHVSMINLLAKNPPIVPELIQGNCTPAEIARVALDMLKHPKQLEEIQSKMAEVVASLGGPGASDRAAEEILSLISLGNPKRDLAANA